MEMFMVPLCCLIRGASIDVLMIIIHSVYHHQGGESTSHPRPRGEDTGPGPCLASGVSIVIDNSGCLPRISQGQNSSGVRLIWQR